MDKCLNHFEAGFLIIMFTKICLQCGKEFCVPANVRGKAKKKRKFCSRGCYAISQKGIKPKNWKQYQEIGIKTRFQKGHKAWNKDTQGLMPEVWNKGLKLPQISGKNHPRWKGGNIKIKCLACNKEFLVKPYKKDIAKFCSRKCQDNFQVGKNHSHWQGGKVKMRNRWYIWKPDYPFIKYSSYVPQYRLIAEKILGRYLIKGEEIHHINEIKDDDRPENLYLFANRSKHMRYHHLKNKPILKSNLLH